MSAPRKSVPRAVAFVLLLGGLVFLGVALVILIPAHASRSWPAAEGIITGHRVVSEHQQKAISHYVIVPEYRYQVEGKTHTGSRYSHSLDSFGSTHRTVEEARQAAHTAPRLIPYQIGKTVPVYYDPRQPSQAVLHRSHGALGWPLLVLSGLLFAGGIQEWTRLKPPAP